MESNSTFGFSQATIPTSVIGPIKITGAEVNDEVLVPMSTYETTLWPSTNRGAKVSRESGGIRAYIMDERMTRSVVVQADSVSKLIKVVADIKEKFDILQQVASTTGRFVKLLKVTPNVIGNLLYLRFDFITGDASGHNMVTKSSDELLKWLLNEYDFLRYISVSANYCVDKKVSAVNAISGRGKKVVAEVTVSPKVCASVLKTTPEKIVELNIKKNYLGSISAGSIMSANAHFANILLAFYLATGQDGANIVEGSQGIVMAEMHQDSLYFSVTLPSIIVGTIGNGKQHDFAQKNLKLMKCLEINSNGDNSRRLAIICGAAVLCGELSLLAAQTNFGELTHSHMHFERR